MTLKMTSAQVVETSVIVNNNSSFQNYTNPDDHTQQTIIVFVELRSYYYIFLHFFKDFSILVTIISETFNL